MRQGGWVVALLLAGCMGSSPPAPAAESSHDPTVPRPDPASPAALGDADGWQILELTGSSPVAAYNVTVPAKAGATAVRALEFLPLGPELPSAWGLAMFRKVADGWQLFGFFADGDLEAEVWAVGQPATQTAVVVPEMRRIPLGVGAYDDVSSLLYQPRLMWGEEQAAVSENEWRLVVGATGPMRLGFRMVADGPGGGFCLRPFAPTGDMREFFGEGFGDCSDTSSQVRNASVAPPAMTGTGFLFALRWELLLDGEGYALVSGPVDFMPGPVPFDDRPNTTARSGTWSVTGLQQGWAFSAHYHRNPATVGRWEAAIDLHGMTAAGQGGAAGPPDIAYVVGKAILGSPDWTCVGEGATGATSHLTMDAATLSQGRLGSEMFLYADLEFGASMDELLGGPSLTTCGFIPPLNILGQ